MDGQFGTNTDTVSSPEMNPARLSHAGAVTHLKAMKQGREGDRHTLDGE